ncbi:hypothetical protein CCR75_005859 [Bremia lactucae]|uniref:Uncharacterized protein n=1 Tax=Bremia lactucae TaxID=4779 RepID=A0A976FFX2_BRELC|nr:hypothetical protein CCR75_005859 [Bremia lactucae]
MVATPTSKQTWHSSITLSTRRSVLFHILLLLKSKYGKVDSKISYIGRRAELALYYQAYSAWEYHNPPTLCCRLYSLVLKLHLNSLIAKEDAALAVEMVTPAPSRKRKCSSSDETCNDKRLRFKARDMAMKSLLCCGNEDTLQLVCSFLTAQEILHCSATCSQTNLQLPAFVVSIETTIVALMKVAPAIRSGFFQRFPNLQSFSLTGRMHAQQFTCQTETTLIARNVLVRSILHALSHAHLPKLAHFSLNCCYTEGLQSHVTRQIAAILIGPSNNFPRLQTLSLVGNCISDDGAKDLYDAMALSTFASQLSLLNLAQNFIGERGHVQMQELMIEFASRGSSLRINLQNNLLKAANPRSEQAQNVI